MAEFRSTSLNETEKIAQQVAKQLIGGETIALSGNLGAGKTVFVKFLAKALKIKDTITSPTFVLMKVYDVGYKKISKLVHVDCYRLDGQEDLRDIGLEEYISDQGTVVVIEWADKIQNLPKNSIKINIQHINDQARNITIC